ncbi:MAG: hypothetical protein KatS3mg092_0700 [Patescibacteria group bacterium]|nr:MAG: hypothetical protein KatS3mg092_0700 [Patescibacteria group bacterium]
MPENNILETIRGNLRRYLKNSQGIGGVEILRRQREMGGKGNFTPLSKAFQETARDRKKLRQK